MKRRIIEEPKKEFPSVPRLAFSPDEAAQSSGLSRAKLYELMKAGILPYRKCGARRLILCADLSATLVALPSGPEAA